MKKFKIKQKKIRNKFLIKNELKKLHFLFLFKNNLLTKILRQKKFLEINIIFFKINILYLYCFKSGKTKNIVKYFNLSYQNFFNLLGNKQIPGFFCTSW